MRKLGIFHHGEDMGKTRRTSDVPRIMKLYGSTGQNGDPAGVLRTKFGFRKIKASTENWELSSYPAT
jgi:hypothetical protein